MNEFESNSDYNSCPYGDGMQKLLRDGMKVRNVSTGPNIILQKRKYTTGFSKNRLTQPICLTTVVLMARNSKIKKNAPSILSTIKNMFAKDPQNPCILGLSGGSMKSFVPDKKTNKLNIITFIIVETAYFPWT